MIEQLRELGIREILLGQYKELEVVFGKQARDLIMECPDRERTFPNFLRMYRSCWEVYLSQN